MDTMETSAVIDTGGIGYEVFLPSGSLLFLKAAGDEVSVHTVQIVKEDDISLYGFDDRTQVALFKLLITVSGVGAKAAMAILSALPAGEVVRAIMFEEATLLTRANGIGKKSAERIVLELKDKVGELDAEAGSVRPRSPGEGGDAAEAGVEKEILALLMTLGYSRSEASQAISQIDEKYDTVEEGVKLALRDIRA
jgi:Holliday junction DNA helicase RuvA